LWAEPGPSGIPFFLILPTVFPWAGAEGLGGGRGVDQKKTAGREPGGLGEAGFPPGRMLLIFSLGAGGRWAPRGRASRGGRCKKPGLGVWGVC